MLKKKRIIYSGFVLFAVALMTLSLFVYGQKQPEKPVKERTIVVLRQPTDSHELTPQEIKEFDTSDAPHIVKARRIAKFKPARDLLIARGFPLEPDVLLENNWRDRLKQVVGQMPEFRGKRRANNKLSGVQFADTLTLPKEGVELTGDTIIIVNDLISEGNKKIKRNGHNLYIFVISEH